MAKNGKIKIAGLIIVLAGLLTSVGGMWAVYGDNIGDNATAIEKLDDEGCKPTQKFELIEYRLGSIDSKLEVFSVKQEAMQIENEESFKEILIELRK